MATFNVEHAARAAFGNSTTPAAPAAITSVRPSSEAASSVSFATPAGCRRCIGNGDRGFPHIRLPPELFAANRRGRGRLRAPATEPRADRRGRCRRGRGPWRPSSCRCFAAARTAAAAVVLAPLASSMTDTRRPNCGIMCLSASASSFSPALTSLPPTKSAVLFRSIGAAREDRAVDQALHLLRLDAAVAEDFVGPGIDGDDAVEDAGVRVAVELDEDLAFVHAFDQVKRKQ